MTDGTQGVDTILVRGAEAVVDGDGLALPAVRDVRVEGSRILETGRLAPRPGERVIDAAGCVLLPAWVNTHHHLFQSVLKGVPGALDASLFRWLREVPYRFGPRIDEEALRVAATIGLAELALSGCGTVADHHYLFGPDTGFDPAPVLFEVADRLGLRFVLLRGGATRGRAFDTPDTRPMPTESVDAMIRAVSDTAARFHDPSGAAMRKVAMAPTTPFWSASPDEMRELARAARAQGLRLHTHLSETADYVRFAREEFGMDPVPWMAEHGWLGPDVSVAHAVHLSDAEIRLLGETGTGISHCPQSNGRLGSGVAPVEALHAAGAVVSVGVDGAASNEAADMASELHAAWLIHRAAKGAGTLGIPRLVEWGTRGGAAVLGLAETGGIRPGMQADLALHALSHPRFMGLHDVSVAPVAAGGAPRLKCLMVAGRVVVEDGALPELDLDALARDARRVVARLRG